MKSIGTSSKFIQQTMFSEQSIIIILGTSIGLAISMIFVVTFSCSRHCNAITTNSARVLCDIFRPLLSSRIFYKPSAHEAILYFEFGRKYSRLIIF